MPSDLALRGGGQPVAPAAGDQPLPELDRESDQKFCVSQNAAWPGTGGSAGICAQWQRPSKAGQLAIDGMKKLAE
jgi:hypothetical protein